MIFVILASLSKHYKNDFKDKTSQNNTRNRDKKARMDKTERETKVITKKEMRGQNPAEAARAKATMEKEKKGQKLPEAVLKKMLMRSRWRSFWRRINSCCLLDTFRTARSTKTWGLIWWVIIGSHGTDPTMFLRDLHLENWWQLDRNLGPI